MDGTAANILDRSLPDRVRGRLGPGVVEVPFISACIFYAVVAVPRTICHAVESTFGIGRHPSRAALAQEGIDLGVR